MIFYDKSAEKLAYTKQIDYHIKTDKNDKVIEHCFESEIDFEYEENPKGSTQHQREKITFKPIRKCYSAHKNSKEAAESYFRQELVRNCGNNIKEVNEDEAKKIKSSWNS